MVIFDNTSKEEILGKTLKLVPSLRLVPALELFYTLRLVPTWKLVPTLKSVHTIRLPGQAVPLVVIFGKTSKQEVLGKIDLIFEFVVKVL